MIKEIDFLKQQGFEGFLSFKNLVVNDSMIPERPGVYVVIYDSKQQPEFLEKGCGGFFKDKDPSVSIKTLEEAWVEGSSIVYIGQAGGGKSKATLRKRLKQYIRFGNGKKVGHWGGRYIWQLANSADLLVCWKTTTEDARKVERQMIAKFKDEHNGKRPFANLDD